MANSSLASSPFVGPRPFDQTDEDRKRFFGRETELDEIVSLIYSQPIVLVYAPSGAGKTSLFNAGVVPKLSEAGFQMLPVARVGGTLRDLAERDEPSNLYVYNALLAMHPSGTPSELPRMRLADFLSSRPRPSDGPRLAARVVAFDQFEEIFTLYSQQSYRQQRDFFFQVGEALENDPLLRIVLLIREDYLAMLEPFADALFTGLPASFRLELLSAEEATRAIEQPVITGTGLEFGPKVAKSLVRELRKIRTKDPAGHVRTIVGQHVEPVQLQVVGDSLWRNLPSGTKVITHEHFRTFGDVDEALAGFYEWAIGEVAKTGAVDEATLRSWFEKKLITMMQTRGTIYQGKQDTGGIPNEVVEELARWHLIRPETRAGARWYELSHDRFIEPILSSNQRWREARRNLITDVAQEWQRLNRDPGSLLGGAKLESARQWAAEHPGELDELERAFLQASVEAAEEIQRQAENAERLQRLVHDLERQAQISLSYQLVAAAVANLRVDPERSVLLSLYATSVLRATESPVTPESEDALHRSVQALRIRLCVEAHDGPAVSVGYSPDGRRIVSAGSDGRIRIWDPISGREILTVADAPGGYTCAAFSPDGSRLAAISAPGTWRIQDAANGEQLLLIEQPHTFTDLAFSPDGQRIATASAEGVVQVWDVTTGEELLALNHGDQVHAVAFSPDGEWLVSAGANRVARVWDGRSGRDAAVLVGHDYEVYCVAFSPDGKRIATGGRDLTAMIWDRESGKKLLTLLGHTNTLTGVAFSPDGALLATASQDRTVRLWGAESGLEVDRLTGNEREILDVAFSPDGQQLATGGGEGFVKVWDVRGREVMTAACTGPVNGLAFSPSGGQLAVAGSDGVAGIWEVASGYRTITLIGHMGSVNGVAFTPDGTRVATIGGDGVARLWEIATGRELSTLQESVTSLNAAAFSPDGRLLAVGNSSHTTQLWEVTGGRRSRTLECSDEVVSVAFSNDGRLSTACRDGNVSIWDIASGEQVLTLGGDSSDVLDVAFSPGGETVATVGLDGTARLWAIPTGELRGELTGHRSPVSSVAFSPDGRLLATGSWDSTVKIWDVDQGVEQLTLADHDDKVTSVAFSPDGRLLASAGDDGMARVHVLSVEDLQRMAQIRVTRSLKLEECEQYIRTPGLERCPPGIEALGLIAQACAAARREDLKRATALLRQAKNLDHYLLVDPKPDVSRLAASVLLAQAHAYVEAEDLDGARDSLRAAARIDPAACSDPEAESRRLLAAKFLQVGRHRVLAGDAEGAQAAFRRAIEMRPGLDIDEAAEAGRLAGFSRLQMGLRLAVSGDIDQAVAAYEAAELLHPGLAIPIVAWNQLCWHGSINGQAERVMHACQRGIDIAGGGEMLDSYSVARALVSDLAGALEGFRAYLEWGRQHGVAQRVLARREAWVAALERGGNPFDEAALRSLKTE